MTRGKHPIVRLIRAAIVHGRLLENFLLNASVDVVWSETVFDAAAVKDSRRHNLF